MKKCSWCGKEYSDAESICSIDRYPLESEGPEAVAQKNREGLDKEIVAPIKPLSLFVRYAIAILISYIISLAVFFFVGMSLALPAGLPGLAVALLLTGFCGVSAGTLTLPPSYWFRGSIVLLILGLVYYCYAALRLTMWRGEDSDLSSLWLVPLAAGGSIVPALVWKYDKHLRAKTKTR